VKYGNIGCIAVLHLYGETCVNGIPNEGTQSTCLIHRYATLCTKAEGGHLGQCFSTAGSRPGTGPWHQLYRAARGSPGILEFVILVF